MEAQHQHHNQSPIPHLSPASPASSTSSPSHEFSFTISLHSETTTTTTSSSSNIFDRNDNRTGDNRNDRSAIDLSPADDIFFHGHLLPLHLLSHLPVSPRSSINSLDSFSLPIKDLPCPQSDTPKRKPKPFSLFSLGRWKKNDRESGEKISAKKMRFDMSGVIKRYVRMVRPLRFFRGRRERRNSLHLQRQPYSFSGVLTSSRDSGDAIGRKRMGQYSAPASMRTSPTNSGLLVATATLPSSTSDSTMEELQAAIQAAIAHCKNSIATSDQQDHVKLRNF